MAEILSNYSIIASVIKRKAHVYARDHMNRSLGVKDIFNKNVHWKKLCGLRNVLRDEKNQIKKTCKISFTKLFIINLKESRPEHHSIYKIERKRRKKKRKNNKAADLRCAKCSACVHRAENNSNEELYDRPCHKAFSDAHQIYDCICRYLKENK
ncbi:unnamed protein product [Trichogramma brassicae]|uniref:Uncharacterized protein n=1 Tax=Trichogramma brassicae TaxID=86971 RepID=A0A6H5HXK6_9HYME|nr:unnamed protein product [Trichogramma brassicae]